MTSEIGTHLVGCLLETRGIDHSKEREDSSMVPIQHREGTPFCPAPQVTSGARSDFQQATREARHMVSECGMSPEIGPVFVEREHESPDMRRRIDGEVTRILREAYARVRSLLVRAPGALGFS